MMLLSLLFCFVLFAPFLELILKLIADRTSFYHCWVLKKISNTSQFLICEKGTYHRSSPPGFSAKQVLKGNETSQQSGEERWEEAVFAGHILSNKGKNPLHLNPKCWNVKWSFNSFQFFTFPKARSYNRHLKWSPYKCNEHNSISYFFWDIFAFRVQGE